MTRSVVVVLNAASGDAGGLRIVPLFLRALRNQLPNNAPKDVEDADGVRHSRGSSVTISREDDRLCPAIARAVDR